MRSITVQDTEAKGARLLLVANRTCPCPALPGQVLERVGDRGGEVLVLAPALNSRLRHWMSDSDGAMRDAEQRMSATIDALRHHGLNVRGEVGDAIRWRRSPTLSLCSPPVRS